MRKIILAIVAALTLLGTGPTAQAHGYGPRGGYGYRYGGYYRGPAYGPGFGYGVGYGLGTGLGYGLGYGVGSSIAGYPAYGYRPYVTPVYGPPVYGPPVVWRLRSMARRWWDRAMGTATSQPRGAASQLSACRLFHASFRCAFACGH